MSVMILPCHLFQHKPYRITNCLYPSSRHQPLFSSSAIQSVLSSDTACFRMRYGLYQASIRAVSYRRSGFFRTPYGLYLPAGVRTSVRTAFSSALRQPASCQSALYFLLLNFRFSVYLSFMLSLSAAAFFCVAHGSEGLAHVVRTQSK